MDLLIRKARKHDKEAFQQLMEQQGKALYTVAKAILKNDEDVADAMQETAMTCWEKIDTLQKDKYFKTWLTRILINKCNVIYRQRMRSIEEGIPEAWFQEEGYANAEWGDFLNCLDEKYRTVIMLYYVHGFKTKEIAQILDVNENTVRGRLVTARKKLEVQYTNSGKIRKKEEFKGKTYCAAERSL
jgi:RNA polymerase sigma factor (sigma-70 family)